MDSVSILLLSIAGIFLIGVVGEQVFQRTHIPDVVWLILAGVLLGPVGGLVTREQLSLIAPYFAAITLSVVLFEGGSRLNLTDLFRAAPRSSALALGTFLFAALTVMLASQAAAWLGVLPAGWTWKHGALLGAILGGSSSIIIMPAVTQARIEPEVAMLVSLESALTDAFCAVGASALTQILVSGSASAGGALLALGRSFGIALAFGLGGGFLWMFVLRLLGESDHAYPVTLAAIFVLHVVISRFDGSAALGILAFAVVLGNAELLSGRVGLAQPVSLGKNVRGFHGQVVFMVKSFFFTFIGLMLGPPWGLFVFGVLVGLLLFASRIPGVLLATLGSHFDRAAQKLMVVALPRGMAAGVLATMPFYAGVPGTKELPAIVFSAVVTTIALFAVGLPLLRRQPRASTPAAAPPTDEQAAS